MRLITVTAVIAIPLIFMESDFGLLSLFVYIILLIVYILTTFVGITRNLFMGERRESLHYFVKFLIAVITLVVTIFILDYLLGPVFCPGMC